MEEIGLWLIPVLEIASIVIMGTIMLVTIWLLIREFKRPSTNERFPTTDSIYESAKKMIAYRKKQ